MEDAVSSAGDRDTATTSTATAVGCPSETAMAGKADVCRGCPGKELCLSQGGQDADQKFIDVRMNAVKRKIIVLSGKGGVGKSTIAATLAMALAKEEQAKVGIVDLDICGPSIPKLMSVEGMKVVNSPYGWNPLISPYHKIKVMSVGSLLQESDNAVVWRGPRKTSLIKRFIKDTFWGKLDYLIFDTPPGTSDEHLSVVKALANTRPEGAIIVSTPQEVALATIRKEINFCCKLNLPVIGLVENMGGFVCPCCQEHFSLFSESGSVKKMAEEYEIPFLGTIPLDPRLVSCCERGDDIFQHFHSSPAARALTRLAETLHRI